MKGVWKVHGPIYKQTIYSFECAFIFQYSPLLLSPQVFHHSYLLFIGRFLKLCKTSSLLLKWPSSLSKVSFQRRTFLALETQWIAGIGNSSSQSSWIWAILTIADLRAGVFHGIFPCNCYRLLVKYSLVITWSFVR